MHLNELRDRAHQQATNAGFWDEAREVIASMRDGGCSPAEVNSYVHALFAQKLALIHSELSEALEEVRSGQPFTHTYYREDGKPEGVLFELIDVDVRLKDLLGAKDIFWGDEDVDVEALTVEKLAYNQSRPRLHGKQF